MQTLRRPITRSISSLYKTSVINSKPLKAGLAPPELDIPEFFEPTMIKSSTPHYYISKQGDQGITVITEQPDLPSFVTLVIYVKAGSRVEDVNSQGYANWLRNSIFDGLSKHPKIFANTTVDFDREFLILKGVCMSYQVEEFLEVMAQTIGPDALNMNVLEYLEEEQDQFFEPNERFLQNTFEHRGLGNPIKGGLNFIENTNDFIASSMDLHKRVLNSENVVIAATGIYNQEAFYKLVLEKFDYLEKPSREDSVTLFNNSSIEPETPKFCPSAGFADLKEALEFPRLEEDINPDQAQLVLGFEGISSRNVNYLTCQVLEALIGEASNFSVGGPGKNSFARAHNIMAHFYNFDSVTCFNTNFQDV
jgi:predicted Zn-dependent peptidase